MIADIDPVALARELPKVELHVHLEGSVAPTTLLELRHRHRLHHLPETVEGLAAFYEFRDFDHFATVYEAVVEALREPEDFQLVVEDFGRELARQNVRYAEVTVTPFLHLRRGVPGAALAAGLEEGRRRVARTHGVELAWVTDVPGHYGPAAADATLDWVLEHQLASTVGFGLGGPEVGVPRPLFADAFARARAHGLVSLPHAGETTGAATVRDAVLHLGARRIGHGVRCLEDPRLVQYLVERGIALEVCPTSNVRLGVVGSIHEHPLPQLLDAGLTVTLNSDDPTMFGATLTDELVTAVTVLGVDTARLVDIVAGSVGASLLAHEQKRTIWRAIDEVVARHRAAEAVPSLRAHRPEQEEKV